MSQVGPPIWTLQSYCDFVEQFNQSAALEMDEFNGGRAIVGRPEVRS
ncbi:hypothetical protein CBM2586_B130510 [Cupriavidus phytorum]|uniref:Uncharacterized protein n=1 Tax=Cupriavidus taiwanensis TaxID=164546 RepID=A0A975XIH9_9BURK|nr:hypothetical protein CBM2586_B130510 [Cupriavidus taiwanensis]